MEKIIVFDFDKTLTNYDTTLPFFLFCCKGNRIRVIFLPLYFLIKIMSKLRFISVKKQKEIGLKFFCPRSIQEFTQLCSRFSETIKLNDLYFTEFLRLSNGNNKIVVASASFQCYLENLFQGIEVIGSLVEVDSLDRIIGIGRHPYKEEKAALLQTKSWSGIKCFYTDSKNDSPTVNLSEKTIWVCQGRMVEEKRK